MNDATEFEGTHLFKREIPSSINLVDINGVTQLIAENNAELVRRRDIECYLKELTEPYFAELGRLGLPNRRDDRVLWSRNKPEIWRWESECDDDEHRRFSAISWPTDYICKRFCYGERPYMLARALSYCAMISGDRPPTVEQALTLGIMLGNLKLFEFEALIEKQFAWKDGHASQIELAKIQKNEETNRKRRHIAAIATEILNCDGDKPMNLTELARRVLGRKMIRLDYGGSSENSGLMKFDAIRRHLKKIAETGAFSHYPFLKTA